MTGTPVRVRALLLGISGALVLGASSNADTADALTWSRPALQNPITINVTESKTWYGLNTSRDYIVKLPASAPYRKGGLNIEGGRNVVIVGGHIQVPDIGRTAKLSQRRGLLLVGQTGTVHVEGLRIDGAGLSEGIDLDQRKGAIVQIQNVHVGAVRAWDQVNFTDNHPDALQTWAGPRELRVDGFTGTTDFQGLMIYPTDAGPYPAQRIMLRRININGLPTARKMFIKKGPEKISYSDLWAEPPSNPSGKVYTYVWPTNEWTNVKQRQRPEGDFVPASSVGLGYRSGASAATASAPAPSPATAPVAAAPSRLLAMRSSKARVTANGSLVLSMVNANPFAVTGRLTAFSTRSRAHRRAMRLGSGTFTAAAGQRVTVRLDSSLRTKSRLRHKRALRARVVVRTTGPSGMARTTKRTMLVMRSTGQR